MENISTLRILYALVKDSAQPTQYACRPAEIITRHDQPWDVILSHLEALAAEEFILFTSPAVITITQKGIEQVTATVAEDSSVTLTERVA